MKRAVFSQFGFCALLVLIQMVSLPFQQKVLFPEELRAEVGTKSAVELLIKIDSNPTLSKGFDGKDSCSFQAKAWRVQDGEQLAGASFVTAKGSGEFCEVHYGAMYFASGTLTKDDIHPKNVGTLNVKEFGLERAENAVDNFFNQIHSSFIASAKEFDEQAQGMVPGMSLGDKRYMNKELNDATKTAGLTHLTAISGAHFAIVIALVGAVLMILGVKRKAASIVQLLAIGAMILLVHPTDSVKRASLMGIIGLLSIFFKRRSQSIAALSFTVISFLLFDPYLALSYGFALSATATASIILLSRPAENFLERYVGKTLASLLAIPIVAQIGCYPILLNMNASLVPYSPLANLLVVPAVEPATLFSLAAVLTAPVLQPLSAFFAIIASFFTGWISWVAVFVSSLPFVKIAWPGGLLGTVLILLMVIIPVTMPHIYRAVYRKITGLEPPEESGLISRFAKWRETAPKRTVQKVQRQFRLQPAFCSIVAVSAVFALVLGLSACGVLKPQASVPENWLIAACDVGQGDSAAIRAGEHSAIVVDTGPKDRSTGGEGVDSCLKKLGVSEIPLLFISHYHDDHMSDIEAALKNRKVEGAVIDPVKQPQDNFTLVDKALQKAGVQPQFAKNGLAGSVGCESGGGYCVKWKVLSVWDDAGENGELANGGKPMKSATDKKTGAEDDRENDSSSVLLFEVNGVSYWTAGDLETKGANAALEQVRAEKVKNVDVLKVNHHGSKTQNNALNELLHPKVTLFMDGKNNYGHPNEKVIQAFEKMGATTLRTDKFGLCTVAVNSDGELEVWAERGV